MAGIKLLLVIMLAVLVTANREIRRVHYKLDGDVTSFEGGSAISFQFEFISSNMLSTLEIEAEQWIHDDALEISAPPHLRIYVKQSINSYSKITAYLRLRKPLSEITLTGASTLTTVNSLVTDTLSLELSGASEGHVTVKITSILYVNIYGAADLFISDFVNDTGYIYVNGAGTVNAWSCPMNIVIVDVKGAGDAYVCGTEAIDITTSGAGDVHYRGH